MGYSLVEVYKDVEEIKKQYKGIKKVSEILGELEGERKLLTKVPVCGLIVSELPEFEVREVDGEMFCKVQLDDGLDRVNIRVHFSEMESVTYGTYVKVHLMGVRHNKVLDKDIFYAHTVKVLGYYEKPVKEVKKESTQEG